MELLIEYLKIIEKRIFEEIIITKGYIVICNYSFEIIIIRK